jgi:hypothetical protein
MTRLRNHKQSRHLKAQDDILSSTPGLDSGCDFQPPEKGREGFSKAKQLIQRLIAQGYDDIDIIIQLHEQLPKDIADIALKNCKQLGIL